MCRTLLLAAALLAAALLPGWPEPSAAADWANVERAIEKTLDEPGAIEFGDVPLQDVVDFLKDRHRIEIQFDNRSLVDAGLDPAELLVTKTLKRISLRSALNLLLGDMGLTYVVENEVLLITTPEAAAERLTTRLYPAADLIVSPDVAQQQRRRRMLLTMITTSIEPATWQTAGGPGSVVCSTFDGVPMLIVTQSYRVHRRIGELLSRQRALVLGEREATAAQRNPSPRQTVYRVGVTASEEKAIEKIEGILTQPTEFDFDEVPLSEVVEFLRKRHQVNIQFDRRGLEGVGVDASTLPVTQSAKDVTLRAGLRLMLRNLDLTYVLHNEALLITTDEAAEDLLEVRVYPVGDSMRARVLAKQKYFGHMSIGTAAPPNGEKTAPGGLTAPPTVLSGAAVLDEVIRPAVAPISWDDAGGPGTIAICSIDGVDVMVIRQTAEVHEQIAQLLDRLREMISPEPPPAATADPRQVEKTAPAGLPAKPSPPTRTPAVMTDPFGD